MMGFFLFATASILALGSIQPHIYWVSDVKLPGFEADHSSPPSAEVKNAWSFFMI
jgi:hypothetical protein